MSDEKAEYEFDYHNFAQVIREIFIFHMNKITGYDPEKSADLSEQGMSVEEQKKVFNMAQKISVQVRELCEKSYQAEITRQSSIGSKHYVAPLYAYALVIYERYVRGDMSLHKALKLNAGRHSELARELLEKLEPETILSPEEVKKLFGQLPKNGNEK